MAKDPAFLFYPGDWLGGTMGMTFEQKGAYFELLLFQFNNGRFTEAQAKQVLSICDASVWHMVKQKFSTDGAKFWSSRLETEIDKRKKFSESRRNNASGSKTKKTTTQKGEAYAKHMENENRNEDEDEDEEKGVQGEKFSDDWFAKVFDDMWMEPVTMQFKNLDVKNEAAIFKLKVRGSPKEYQDRDTGSIRTAFLYQLQHSKASKKNGNRNGNEQSIRRADAKIESGRDFGTFS